MATHPYPESRMARVKRPCANKCGALAGGRAKYCKPCSADAIEAHNRRPRKPRSQEDTLTLY